MSEKENSVELKIREFVYDSLYFKRDMELYFEYGNRVNNGETISIEEQQVYNDATARLMQYNMRLKAQNTNIWGKYGENTASAAVVEIESPATDQLPGNVSSQSGAAWYNQEWKKIAAANPAWSEQQVYDELSRQIGEANWNARYQNIMADIANSRNPAEREQKIKYYESELITFQASGIDVGNDIAFLRETQGLAGESSIIIFESAPDETTWVEPELTEQRKSEGLTLEYNPLGQLWLVDTRGNPTQEELYRFSKQLEHVNGLASNLARTFVYDSKASFADNVHKFFDMAGFAPGAGAIPDLANSALYFTEGNYKEAGWSALAAIPGLGDGFAAARITNKFGKVVEGVREGQVITPELKYKKSWTSEQRAAADAKVEALNNAEKVKTIPQRGKTAASSIYKKANGSNSIPKGYDIDHKVDLQLGGKDDITNMWPLDSSVNRSLGKQVNNKIKDLPDGTPIDKFNISD